MAKLTKESREMLEMQYDIYEWDAEQSALYDRRKQRDVGVFSNVVLNAYAPRMVMDKYLG